MTHKKKTIKSSLKDSWIDERSLRRRHEARILSDLMMRLTNEEPKVYQSHIIGFGKAPIASSRDNKYPFLIGFAARQRQIAIYLSPEINKKVFDQLGKHTKGVNCLYFQKIEDIDLMTLEDILKESLQEMKML
ncbi:MAG: hypothetical protein RBR75_05020 [Acholeplasmataceae bacterium]|jgi:hypothetical protein|nr:hypothetical protein [Acholeplasmataceae bacterium]